MLERGCIVLLQETHLLNCVRTNWAEVIILYNKQYNLVNKFADNDGRQLIGVVESDDNKIIVVNNCFPNVHKQGLTFAETI